jgi:hypothetical protein
MEDQRRDGIASSHPDEGLQNADAQYTPALTAPYKYLFAKSENYTQYKVTWSLGATQSSTTTFI